MSSSTAESVQESKRTFRRFEDGDHIQSNWQQSIFNADHSHKCPTYVQSTPPCQGACPSGEDIRGYLDIVHGIEKPPSGVPWQEYAWRRLTLANPLPSVMGRVCPAPCQTSCNRSHVDQFVGINSVEHYLGDYAIEHRLRFQKSATPTHKTVAVIGSGPAGLSAAYQLALRGHAVTIFEQQSALGGMMRYGIPAFRTPRHLLDAEIERILDLGVSTKINCTIGIDVSLADIRSQFDATFIAVGAQLGRPLPCEGSNAPNCVTATAFLQAFNQGRLHYVGKRIVVVGGGDTSIDVATVSRRLGYIDAQFSPAHQVIGSKLEQTFDSSQPRQNSIVTLTSVFTVDKMQASAQEVHHAKAEGIDIRAGMAPLKVLLDANGMATALLVIKCEAKMVGPRLEIKHIPGTEQVIAADLIVSAIGQAVDFTGMESLNNGKGAIGADKSFQVPNENDLFVGGDAIRPHLLTTAIGHGAIAAEGIDRFLCGLQPERRPKIDVHSFDLEQKLGERGLAPSPVHEPIRGTDRNPGVIHNFENRSDRYVINHKELFLGHFAPALRKERKHIALNAEQALGNFQERALPLSEEQIKAESKRCMSCGLCIECDNCVVYCPQKAVFKVPKSKSTTGRYVDTDYDKCIGCHICKDVCPTGYIQMGLGE